MVPEIGHFALILAFCVSIVQCVLPLLGAHRRNLAWMALARPAARAQAMLVIVSFACLAASFAANDFSVDYVARNSNTLLPVYYRLAATWGSHEGSLLLWALILALWTFAVSIGGRHLPDDFAARVLGVLGFVSAGFQAFLLFTSNPFARLIPGAQEGRDLNPLLQDPGMIFHPPLLYTGYVGFSVAFAFAIAALLSGRFDAAWARWSRPWTTVAWLFLTLGIALGSGWAYYELGWGGWWFWDPVENASFMPWLVGTALIHSLAVSEKRGAFRSWTVLLAIAAFSFSLLGTFLVRSGVLTSVHAFATDPRRGLFVLTLLAFVIGGSLLLYAWRANRMGGGGQFAGVSREVALLINNVALAVAAGAVMLGTLYPLFIDALGWGKISVGPPYFEAVFVPIMVPIVTLMVIGPFVRWKGDEVRELLRRLGPWLGLAVVLGIATAFAKGGSWRVAMGMALAAWVFVASLRLLAEQMRRPGASLAARLRGIPAAWWGMWLAHLGVGVFVVGVTMVKGFETSEDVRMQVGDSTQLGAYTFRLDALDKVKGPNYTATRALLRVEKDGTQIAVMDPEKRVYVAQEMPMTEAAIRPGLTSDVYVSLGEPLADQSWIVRLYLKPFVSWIWSGCVLMALGGLLAATDRRYRKLAQRESTVLQQAVRA
ncbi:MAG: heme lyase CcmF/NrfE family subunit [Rhodocyclaceae bacterium]|nr:heme lyase CcmF/NrfE family subunit [Rhodocyclaceae bacterium]